MKLLIILVSLIFLSGCYCLTPREEEALKRYNIQLRNTQLEYIEYYNNLK